MKDLTRFGVSLPSELISAFDESIKRRGYANRSEAIRDMMRDRLVEEEWESYDGDVVATVTIVYDHETRELSSALNHIQHHFHSTVICTTHVHMDEHNCLEVVVLKGRADAVRKIADRLISTKGVKHGRLVCSTTGERLH